MNRPCSPVPHEEVTSTPTTPSGRRGRVLVNPAGVLALLAWAIPAAAFAYPGEALLQFGAQYIIAPLGIFAVVIALAASFFNPRAAAGAVFAAILCAVLFFVIHMAGQITSVFQT